MHKLYFLIGASGAGKTAAAEYIEKMQLPHLKIYYFDNIGVPSPEVMEKQWGSGEEWQRTKTHEWVARLKEELARSDIILDGQVRPSFVIEACKASYITEYDIVLLDCTDDVRKERLIGRGQAELANDRMMNWARFLRDETKRVNGTIIVNDTLSIRDTAKGLLKVVGLEV